MGLLLIAFVSIGITLTMSWQLEGGAAAVNETGRMRMQAWRLASLSQAGANAAQHLELVQEFDRSLWQLKTREPSRPLNLPHTREVQDKLLAVDKTWHDERKLWLSSAPDAAISIGAAVILVYTGYMYVIGPLERLRLGRRQLKTGDFDTRIAVDTDDEFGQIAAGFNQLDKTLKSSYEGPEAKVEAKTRGIEAQRAGLEVLYRLSAFLSHAGTVDELAHGFSQRVRTLMKADAAALRWSDAANERYPLMASGCLPTTLAQERALLARNLHDSIAQSLSFLNIQVQLLRTAHARDEPAGRARVLDELDIDMADAPLVQ